jgi:hypothetical protein
LGYGWPRAPRFCQPSSHATSLMIIHMRRGDWETDYFGLPVIEASDALQSRNSIGVEVDDALALSESLEL